MIKIKVESLLTKNKKEVHSQSHNESGMALLMVISSIVLLTWLLADFTFETKVNKLKSYNYQDRLQAKLNAESGLKFALAKLRIYKEARNLIESNESIKSVAKPSAVEGLIIAPFVYPIPLPKNADVRAKSAVEEFSSKSLIKGEFQVSISKVKGFLNPNNLRLPAPKNPEDPDQDQEDEDDSDSDDPNKKIVPHKYMEKKFIETVKDSIEQEKEKNEVFSALYGDLEPDRLVKELKFYVNNPNIFQDSLKPEFESLYLENEVSPKYGPLNSIEELYQLVGWPDAIVDLLKDKMTVHEVSFIALNEIDKDQLKILFPSITEDQIELFFRHRNGDKELEEEGKEFKSVEDFKELIVQKLGIIDNEGFEKRVKDLEQAGLKLGIAGKLYKVNSVGTFNRSVYKITAYVDLPVKPEPKKEPKKEDPKSDGNKVKDPNDPDDDQDPNDLDNDPNKKKKEEEKPLPLELMEPRVIEIINE